MHFLIACRLGKIGHYWRLWYSIGDIIDEVRNIAVLLLMLVPTIVHCEACGVYRAQCFL